MKIKIPFLLLSCLIGLPLCLATPASDGRLIIEPSGSSPHVTQCNPGPWGALEYVQTTLETPDAFAAETLKTIQPMRWFFGKVNQQQLLSVLKESGLPQDDFTFLANPTNQVKGTNGFWVFPTDRLIMGMQPEVRVKIYAALAPFSANGFHYTPYVFRPELLERRFDRCGLSEKTIADFKSLLYPRGDLMLFSDLPTMTAQVADPAEKLRLIKTISRRATLLMRLKLDETSDVDALTEYWGVGGRAKDTRLLLDSVTHVPDGWEIDVAHLLPGFVRKRICTYPSPLKKTNLPAENCHWSSLNFFNDPVEQKYLDFKNVQAAIDQDYEVVTGPKLLGDLILLVSSSDEIVHSAVHVADDIMFTKNGGSDNQPWIFMKLEDMLILYQHPDYTIKVVVCRRKDLLTRK